MQRAFAMMMTLVLGLLLTTAPSLGAQTAWLEAPPRAPHSRPFSLWVRVKTPVIVAWNSLFCKG